MEDRKIQIGESLEELLFEKSKTHPLATIPKIAEHLHVKPATVYRWFNRQNIPSMKSLISLADYFDCSVDYIVGLTDFPNFYKNSDEIKFSARLKELSEKCGLSGAMVAQKLDLNRSILSKWTTIPTRLPDTENMIKLSELFGCSIEYLIGRTDVR